MSRQLYDDDDFYDDYGDDYDDYDDYARPPVPAKAPPKAPPKAPAAAKAPSAKPAAKPSPVAKNVTTGSLTHKSVPKPTTGTTESPSLSPKPVTSSAARAPTKPTKPSVHLIVVGHVDAGKSTLVGHFLHLLGEVSDNVLRKHQREATNAGKGSFAYAWALDENAEERARGVTMDVAGQHFETGSRHVVLLDAPGHRDFIPKLIAGAVMADVACLVVDATAGEFESGFENGTTQEHVVLVRSLGVQELVVCVNKMDNVEWNKDRYDSIAAKLRPFLEQAGFRQISFIPCSGLSGDNLKDRSTASAWYDGKTLLETIDSCALPVSSADGAMRLVVHNFAKGGPLGFALHGIIVSGRLTVGDRILMLPCGEVGICKAIEVHGDNQHEAMARESVTLYLSGNFDTGTIGAIDVACTPDSPVPVSKEILAQVVSFDLQIPLIPGTKVILHTLGVACEATLKRIRHLQNPRTGSIEQLNPRRLPAKASAVIELITDRDFCVEEFKVTKDLGRITLRAGNQTVAAGIVLATNLK